MDQRAPAQAAREGVRVAEFGPGSALAYCGKLFADFGADVIKVEPPGGDPDRQGPPLGGVGGGRAGGGGFARGDTHKRSVTVVPDDPARLREIAGAADVLIDARPGAWDDAGPAGQGALRAAFP